MARPPSTTQPIRTNCTWSTYTTSPSTTTMWTNWPNRLHSTTPQRRDTSKCVSYWLKMDATCLTTTLTTKLQSSTQGGHDTTKSLNFLPRRPRKPKTATPKLTITKHRRSRQGSITNHHSRRKSQLKNKLKWRIVLTRPGHSSKLCLSTIKGRPKISLRRK